MAEEEARVIWAGAAVVGLMLGASGPAVTVTGEVLRMPSTDRRLGTRSAVLVLMALRNNTTERLLFGSGLGVSDITFNVDGCPVERAVEGGVPGGVVTSEKGQESGDRKDWCFAGGQLHALAPGETYFHQLEVTLPVAALDELTQLDLLVRVRFVEVTPALECPRWPTDQVYGGEVLLRARDGAGARRRATCN
jgi:hypothetical protein